MLTIQEKISKILWDRRYIVIPDEIDIDNNLRTLILKDPSLEDRNFYIYLKEFHEYQARQNNVPTEGEIFQAAKINGYWTDHDDKILKETDEHIAFLKSELSRQKFLAKKKNLEKQIKECELNKTKVLRKQEQLKIQTAEYLAHEIAVFYLLQKVVYKINNERLWFSEEDFLKTKNDNLSLIIFLSHSLLSEGLWETFELREIARSVEWRLVWSLNKKNLSGLFDRPVSNLNINQKLLIYWSRVYDSAFEDPKCPKLDVINNDELFDEWLANRDLNKNEEKDLTKSHQEYANILDGEYIEQCICGANKIKAKGLGEKARHTNECPYGTWRAYSLEEKEQIAKQIYGRNIDSTRKILDQEQDALLKHGSLEEQKLRNKKTRQLLGMNQKIIPVHKK